MATLTPPFVLIDALGTKNITAERTEQFAQLLARAQEVAPEACEVLLELKEVLLRLEPSCAEQWMAELTKELPAYDLAEDPERQLKIRTVLSEMFVRTILDQLKPVLNELNEMVDLNDGKPMDNDDPILAQLLAQKMSFKWQPILDFYTKAKVLTPVTQKELNKTMAAIKNFHEISRRTKQKIQNEAAAKARHLNARAKRKKR